MAEEERRGESRIQRAREETLAVLEMRHSGQRLGLAEYERSVGLAQRATTTAELEQLLRTAGSPGPPARLPPSELRPRETELDPSDEQGIVFALMSGAQRKGPWEPPARLYVSSVMGGVDLDFREADLLEGVTQVIILTVMGGVNIVVPPDLEVISNGFGLLGGFKHLRRRGEDRNGPVLKITGLALMAGVNIKVK